MAQTFSEIPYSSTQKWRSSLCIDIKTKTKQNSRINYSVKQAKCKTIYGMLSFGKERWGYICIYIHPHFKFVCINKQQKDTQETSNGWLEWGGGGSTWGHEWKQDTQWIASKYCFKFWAICGKLRKQLRKKWARRQRSRAISCVLTFSLASRSSNLTLNAFSSSKNKAELRFHWQWFLLHLSLQKQGKNCIGDLSEEHISYDSK